MATFVSTSRFELWWRKAQAWFATQFASINVDLTPVEEKVDEVKSDVADVKTAVENIDFTPLAKDATVAKEAAATVNKETIMGGKLPVNTEHSIPAILWGDEILDIDSEGELFMHSSVLAPEGFGVGSVVTAENMTDGEEDMYYVTKAVNNPSVSYDGQDYSISGATLMMVEKGKCYRCTSIVPLSYTEDDETITGELYVYEEYEPGRSGKEIYEKVDDMREAYDNLSQAAEAYNTGKVQLAQNITEKGVQASATETLPELAEKVAAISQETYEINGGEMYAKQLFGSLVAPNYWNLYEVMAALLSHGDLVNYGGILLGEYYKGYDSIAIGGSGAPSAGAGGGYVFSDDVELVEDAEGNKVLQAKEGHVFLHTIDEVHYWDDNMDSYADRWVAWVFAQEGHGFGISNNSTCPRKIYIGRNVGSISTSVDIRLSEIVVPDGNYLGLISPNGHNISFSKNVVLRNIGNIDGTLVGLNANTLYIEQDGATFSGLLNGTVVETAVIKASQINNISNSSGCDPNNLVLYAPVIIAANCLMRGVQGKTLILISESVSSSVNFFFESSWQRVILKYMDNDRSKSFIFTDTNSSSLGFVLEIMDGWCKNLSIPKLNASRENIVNLILNRLGVNQAYIDNPIDSNKLTITLGSTNLAKLTEDDINIAVQKGFTLA